VLNGKTDAMPQCDASLADWLACGHVGDLL